MSPLIFQGATLRVPQTDVNSRLQPSNPRKEPTGLPNQDPRSLLFGRLDKSIPFQHTRLLTIRCIWRVIPPGMEPQSTRSIFILMEIAMILMLPHGCARLDRSGKWILILM